jgi:hypothetical protein
MAREMQLYLTERDTHRGRRGAVPAWAGRAVGLAGCIWGKEEKQVGLTRVKGGFEKFWTGRNQVVYGKQEGLCQLCNGGMESLSHIMWGCTEQSMVTARTEVLHETTKRAAAVPKAAVPVVNMANQWRRAATRDKSINCWTGLIGSDDVDRLVPARLEVEVKDLHKLAKYCSLYSKGWGTMMRTRAKALGAQGKARTRERRRTRQPGPWASQETTEGVFGGYSQTEEDVVGGSRESSQTQITDFFGGTAAVHRTAQDQSYGDGHQEAGSHAARGSEGAFGRRTEEGSAVGERRGRREEDTQAYGMSIGRRRVRTDTGSVSVGVERVAAGQRRGRQEESLELALGRRRVQDGHGDVSQGVERATTGKRQGQQEEPSQEEYCAKRAREGIGTGTPDTD